MRAATLFSGIGAPEQAMPSWQWLWSAEIDRFPSAVLATRHPHSVNLGDVSAPDFAERALDVGRPDVLVFGSPCQSFSVAGKRLGLDDPRGNLALVALGLVERVRPAWFVFENVPGLLSIDGGKDFGAFLWLVGQLGYGWAYRVLDAQHFGVAQRRRRVFVVGCLGDWRRAAAVLFEPESLRGDTAPRDQARQAVAGSLGAGSSRSGGRVGRREAAAGHVQPVTPPLTSNPYGDHESREGLLVAHSLRGEGFDAGEDGTGRGTPLVPVAQAFNWQSDGDCRGLDLADVTMALQREQVPAVAFSCKDHGADAGGIATTLRAMGHGDTWQNGGGQVAVAFDTYNQTVTEGAVQTLCSRGDTPGGNAHLVPAVASAMQVRRLTPRECERLQGFPDDYTAISYRGKPAADGPRYKALGNSMAVPVLHWLLTRLEAAHAAMLERAA